MSTDVTASVEIQPESVEVGVLPDNSIVVANDHCITPENPDSIVSAIKKEYSVVGDAFYASVSADDAPQWLLNIIDATVNNAVAGGMLDYDLLVQDVRNAIDALDTAANTYVEEINFDARVDTIVGTHLVTLNATLGNTYATIVDLNTVVANSDYALSQAINDITTAYTDEITSRITSVQTAFTNADTALAQDITALTAAFADQEGNLSATANAVSGLQTYVGLSSEGNPDGTGMLSRINILEKQNDGVIEYTIDTYDVMIGIEDPNTNVFNDELDVSKEPYASWLAADTVSGTEETRAAHVGDVYIMYADDVNGTRTYLKSYKFIKTAVDDSPPYSTDPDGYTWALITDTDAQAAYVIALNAQDLADSKRRVFTNTPYPPYDTGDLWIRLVGASNQIWRATAAKSINEVYDLNDWLQGSTDDYAVTTLSNGLTAGTVAINLSSATVNGTDSIVDYVANEIDKEVVVYSGTDVSFAPTGKLNDIFIENKEATAANGDVYTETTIYTHNGSTWVAQTNADTSIAGLADLADGKRTIYSNQSHDVPSGEENDIWIPTTGLDDITYVPREVYQYQGTSWVLATTYTENLTDFVDNIYTPDSTSLHNQLDGKIEYYFYGSYTEVSGATSEATALSIIDDAWTTEILRENANGNVVYFKDTRNAYWYQSSTNSWLVISDTSIYEALQNAATAQSTADGVVVSYYAWDQTTAPATNYLWFTDAGLLQRYNGSSWENVATKDGDTLTAYDDTTKDVTFYEYQSGTWAAVTTNGLVANSKAFTDLNLALTTLDNSVFGESGLEQTLNAAITDEGTRVESKFAYDSTIGVNGLYYTAGFGLVATATGGDGSEGSPYDSEFWINAEKFRFTNTNQSGTASPFTIDATGTTPEITFSGVVNGVIDFVNTDMSTYDNANVDISSPINENNDDLAQQLGYTNYSDLVAAANAGHTIINGGYLNTDLLQINDALISGDGLFYLNMDTKKLHSQADNGDYLEITPSTMTVVDASTGDYGIFTSEYMSFTDVSTGDYVTITPGTMQFVDASDSNNNLTWQNGTLILPRLCVDTLQILDNAVTVPVAAQNDATINSSNTTGALEYLTALSFVIDSAGQPINILTTCDLTATGSDGIDIYVKYSVGGTDVLTRKIASQIAYDSYATISSPAFTISDQIGGTSGAQTVTIYIGFDAAANGAANKLSLKYRRTLAIGIKK